MITPQNILKTHKLRITNCRLDIIQKFLDRQVALAHSDLEDSLQNQFDRVTIYRTLNTFLEQDIIHKVLDDSGSTKYALCSPDEAHEHDHEHVHFKCEKCGETSCLEAIHLPPVQLPPGYKKNDMSLLITGTCQKCN